MLESVISPLQWHNDTLVLLDQRLLPQQEVFVTCRAAAEVVTAITTMVVRGAPAIGIAGAYGAVLAAREAFAASPAWRDQFARLIAVLREARPTAVNLAWAIDHMAGVAARVTGDPTPTLLRAAQRIHAEDLAANHRMGELGAQFIAPGSRVMTHCNAGALATAGYGTALGVVRSAYHAGRIAEVFATETRPWLQGARLTAWELHRDHVPVRLITDGSAAHVMREQQIGWVIVGADRVAANGDVANKIGTYGLALLARAHGARFMVVAPWSTVDLKTPNGAAIPIEERAGEEVLEIAGSRFAAPGVLALNPVFDVTPAALIDVLVTEIGVIERPTTETLLALAQKA